MFSWALVCSRGIPSLMRRCITSNMSAQFCVKIKLMISCSKHQKCRFYFDKYLFYDHTCCHINHKKYDFLSIFSIDIITISADCILNQAWSLKFCAILQQKILIIEIFLFWGYLSFSKLLPREHQKWTRNLWSICIFWRISMLGGLSLVTKN